MKAHNSSLHYSLYLIGPLILILLSSVPLTLGSAEECLDPNQFYPNEEQFCGEYVYWNATSIETPLTTIGFEEYFEMRVAFDLYQFLDDKKQQTYAQIEILPIWVENYDTTMNLVLDDTAPDSARNPGVITNFFVFECTTKKNGNLLHNYSYIFGVDNYLDDVAGTPIDYKRIIVPLDNATLNDTDRYAFDFSVSAIIQIQLPENNLNENYTLVSDSGEMNEMIVRRVSRSSNENLEVFFMILNSDYFDIGLFIIGILCTILFGKKSSPSSKSPKSVIQFNIACRVSFLPNVELQEKIKPYFLYMFTPIPLIFLARWIPMIGYFLLLFYLNFIPIFVIIYYWNKHQTLLPFKSFIIWQFVTLFVMYFVILSVAFSILGYFLDLMQLILYLLTFVYIFDLVRDRKVELDANAGKKKSFIGLVMIVLLVILILKYIIPLIMLLVVQSFIAGDYPVNYQYYLYFLEAGLNKIRWNMGIGGILLFVYIINQFQYNLLQTYDRQAEKKFVLKLVLSIYIFVYIMATIVIGDLAESNLNVLSEFLPPWASELQKNLIPYSYLTDLYPEDVILGLRSFISTTPSPFWNNNPLTGLVWVNSIIVFGILCFLPRLCFIIGAPARMRYYDYEKYFHRQYQHYYVMSGIITVIFAFFSISFALDLCLLIFLGTILTVSIRLLKGLK